MLTKLLIFLCLCMSVYAAVDVDTVIDIGKANMTTLNLSNSNSSVLGNSTVSVLQEVYGLASCLFGQPCPTLSVLDIASQILSSLNQSTPTPTPPPINSNDSLQTDYYINLVIFAGAPGVLVVFMCVACCTWKTNIKKSRVHDRKYRKLLAVHIVRPVELA